jgi:hypothetical protein
MKCEAHYFYPGYSNWFRCHGFGGLGVNQLFSELPLWKEVIHKAAYMFWGTILLCVMLRLKIIQ